MAFSRAVHDRLWGVESPRAVRTLEFVAASAVCCDGTAEAMSEMGLLEEVRASLECAHISEARCGHPHWGLGMFG